MTIDIVGSFLPPESLTRARRMAEAGTIDAAALAKAEDDAVGDLVERQLQTGLKEVTSGELRRTYWDKDFYFGLSGVDREHINSGRIYQSVESGEDLLRISGPIAFNPEHPFFDDYAHLHAVTAGRAVARQTIPSPASLYLEILGLTDGHPERIYPAGRSLQEDIAEAYRATIAQFYRLGCRSLQLDDTACGMLCQNNYTKRLLQGGIDLVGLHETVISLINGSLAGHPSDMEVSLYLSGGDTVVPEWEVIEYPDNIMPKILSRAAVDKFFMPFDLGNSYQPAVLRHVRDGIRVVLGLTEAHSPYADHPAEIRAQITESSLHIDRSRLSVSPRTGFKLSSYAVRGLTSEDQWQKLSELLRIVAELPDRQDTLPRS